MKKLEPWEISKLPHSLFPWVWIWNKSFAFLTLVIASIRMHVCSYYNSIYFRYPWILNLTTQTFLNGKALWSFLSFFKEVKNDRIISFHLIIFHCHLVLFPLSGITIFLNFMSVEMLIKVDVVIELWPLTKVLNFPEMIFRSKVLLIGLVNSFQKQSNNLCPQGFTEIQLPTREHASVWPRPSAHMQQFCSWVFIGDS